MGSARRDRFIWIPKDVRLLLDYIDNVEETKRQPDIPKLVDYLNQNTHNVKKGEYSIQRVKGKIEKLISRVGKSKIYRSMDLWTRGLSILNLHHSSLKGVYTSEEIKTIDARTASTTETSKEESHEQSTRSSKRKRVLSVIETHNGSTHDARPAKRNRNGGDSNYEQFIPRFQQMYGLPQDANQEAAEIDIEQSAPPMTDSDLESDLSTIPEPHHDLSEDDPSSSSAYEHPINEGHEGLSQTTEQVPIPVLQPGDSAPCATEHVETCKSMREIYQRIQMAVETHMNDLGLDEEEPLFVQNIPWNNNLTDLMKIVFGYDITPEHLNADLANILPSRPIPKAFVLRSLVAAAVKKWVLESDPLGASFIIPGTSRDGQALAYLEKVIKKKLGKGVRNMFRHEATQMAVKASLKYDLQNRPSAMARDLCVALSPFFTPASISYKSEIKKPYYLYPMPKDTPFMGYPPAGSEPLPPIQSIPPSKKGGYQPYPGTSRFESLLKEVFKTALELRSRWVFERDAKHEFEFPAFRWDFDERVHFNEEFQFQPDPRNGNKLTKETPTDMRSKIFLCMIPGVRCRARRRYSEGYGGWCLISKAGVFMLE